MQTIVIFGASGDLTSRKLVPALYELYRKRRLPAGTRIVGFSRTPFAHDAWREKLAESTAQFVRENFDAGLWQSFAQDVYYHAGDADQAGDVVALAKFLDELEGPAAAARIYYLATAPQFFEPVVLGLGSARMVDESRGQIGRAHV